LADLGLQADAIQAVGDAVAATPVFNPRDFTKEDVCYLVQQAYLGAKPSQERN
jgi:alcohol dehydrogenase class IV